MCLHKLSDITRQLKNPDNTYRTQTFWSWNGNLQEEELNHQLLEFKDKGIGGFFMHAREGLETPYLSEQWKDRIRSCAEEGKRLGLHPYIYDDDKWPSGMAGGKVAAVNPDFRAMAIVLTKKDSGSFCYGAQIAGKTLLQLHEGEPSQEETPLFVDVQYSETSDWYSGSTPANNLNPESVRAFLDMTHEQYKKLFDGKLSDYVDGFFTDEPNFADFFAAFEPHCPWLPWTADFDVYFQEKRGYSIIPLLPYLFYQGEQAPKVRHDYWRTITERFSQTYFKQIYDWCEENGVINTGHMLFENGLCSQARVCGAAMPHFQYLHIPGVDILGERTEEYLTVKQCTSVAHQMGRRAVSESYGCTGWQLSFEGQKWLWDWQAVQGISVRCPHLAQYSIKGLRKRDYPPVFNYQAAWWEHNKRIRRFGDTECWFCRTPEDMLRYMEYTVLCEGKPYIATGGRIEHYPKFVPEDHVFLKLTPSKWEDKWYQWNQELPGNASPEAKAEAREFSELKIGYRGDLRFSKMEVIDLEQIMEMREQSQSMGMQMQSP